jgi:hypothetical protein
MTLQELGSIGEFLGFLAILVTLFYLAKQNRQSITLSRASEQRILIDQGNTYFGRMVEQKNLSTVRKALASYRSLSQDDKAVATLIFIQWVNQYEQCLHAHEAGTLPSDVLEAFQNFCISFLTTPGGNEYWNDIGARVHGLNVSTRISEILDSGKAPAPVTDTFTFLQSDDT